VEVGKSDISRIDKLCYHYDKLQSKWSQPESNHRKRHGCIRAGARMQRRIRNLVDDLHKKQQNGLAKITILYFNPNSRPRGWFLKVAGKSAQRLLEISLLGVTIKTRLMNKAREYPKCRVIICNKEYNVDIFIAKLEAQRSSNVQDVIKNLIEILMQLEIFY
jgi:putative transposase